MYWASRILISNQNLLKYGMLNSFCRESHDLFNTIYTLYINLYTILNPQLIFPCSQQYCTNRSWFLQWLNFYVRFFILYAGVRGTGSSRSIAEQEGGTARFCPASQHGSLPKTSGEIRMHAAALTSSLRINTCTTGTGPLILPCELLSSFLP